MSPVRMSRIESPVRITLAFNEAFNRHDVTGMMKLVKDDCLLEHHEPAPDGTSCTGKTAVAQFWHAFFQASPHAHKQIEDIFGMGKRCILRWKYEWVNAEGQQNYVRGVDIFHIKNDLISEQLSYIKG